MSKETVSYDGVYPTVTHEDSIPVISDKDRDAVPFQLARKLKDYGFNGEVSAFYTKDGKRLTTFFPADFNDCNVEYLEKPECSAPIWEEVRKYFRDWLGIYIIVDAFYNDSGDIVFRGNKEIERYYGIINHILRYGNDNGCNHTCCNARILASELQVQQTQSRNKRARKGMH